MPRITEVTNRVNSQQTYFYYSFDLTNSGLKSWFGKVRAGQPEVFDTPFAKGESTKQLLDNWIDHLESLKTQWPTLYQFELDLAKKVGPMSVELPLAQRIPDIDAYYEGILLPSEPIDGKAIAAVLRKFSDLRGLNVRSQERVVANMKLSTNSGSPYFTKRREVISKTVPVELDYSVGTNPLGPVVSQILHGETWAASAILGWRGQEGGPNPEDVKQRVVWMFPFGVNVSELMVYQPFIESAQRYGIVPAWISMDAVDWEITKMFDSKGQNDLVVCTDFTKFDQHFNSSLQQGAEVLLSRCLSPTLSSGEWLDQTFPIKYLIPLAYDWGKVRFGKHGMGSGSAGTNCDETLAHMCLQYEAAIRNGAKLNPHSQCLGDDGVLTYPGITVEDVVQAYTSHGLEMNADKQSASTQDCTYLRRWHHKDYRIGKVCVGVYSTCRALGRLRYLERWMNPTYWDAKAVALRQLAIIENVKYHPLKEEFVEYCMKRDKYRLGIDIPHFLDDIELIAREKIEHMPDFLGYTRTLQSGGKPAGGIKDWWVVNYLKSK